MPEVIVDTSAIQYLYQLGQLELLPKLYGHVTVPKSVADEIAAGLAHGISLPQINSLDWLIVQHARHEGLLVISADLGSGEREVLELALEIPNSLVILDDGLARKYARAMGLAVSGTLGILLKAKQGGLIQSVKQQIDKLNELHFRLDKRTYDAVLKLSKE